jgi:GNAT superfamily N-acetyltransferase
MGALRIRDARAEDHALFCRFHAELGVPDPTPDVARWAEELAPNALFVDDDDGPAAYGLVFPRGEAGHVTHVVVSPDRRGQGLGRVIMEEAARRLRTAGCRRWFLNVRHDNTTAIALYQRHGLRAAHRAWSLCIPGPVLLALPFDASVAVTVLTDAEARAAEARYQLHEGSANRPPGIGLGAWRGGTLCGAARFVAAVARAVPFKVHDPGVIRPLAEAMLRRLQEPGAVKLVLEGQPDEARWLVERGAIEEMELLHMVGVLED